MVPKRSNDTHPAVHELSAEASLTAAGGRIREGVAYAGYRKWGLAAKLEFERMLEEL